MDSDIGKRDRTWIPRVLPLAVVAIACLRLVLVGYWKIALVFLVADAGLASVWIYHALRRR
jgi:hypothetical protein